MESEAAASDIGKQSDSDDADAVYHLGEAERPIPNCRGISRDDWCKKQVSLVDNTGLTVASAYVEFAKEWQSINGRTELGKEYVGVVVCEVVQTQTALKPRTLQRWPIKCVLYEGVSLHEHERKYNHGVEARAARLGDRRGSRQYFSLRHASHPPQKKRKDLLVEKKSIAETLKTSCCKRKCLTQFSPALIETLRYELHHSDTKSKDSIKLAIHRNFHYIPGTCKKVCVLEGKVICMCAWRMIYGVSKTDFYRYRAYAASGRRAQQHGLLGTQKTSTSTAQALQTMSVILTTTADSMPHRTRTITTGVSKGEKVVQKILPSGTKWKNILEEVNKVQKQCGEKVISQSSCSKIRKGHFSEYQIKRRGDNFARCGRCDELTALRNVHAYGSPGYKHANQLLQFHLREQEASRAHYYLSRALACYRPAQVLCVMHDKVDHSKTASPCFAAKNKAVDGLMKLPISVTGMLAHGHGDKKYAHYALDLYPADSNQTIGSIARLLRDLENPPKSANPESLFFGAGTTDLYQAILSGSEQCISSVPFKPLSPTTSIRSLPPILHVQLDNCWKDNKSRHMKCFWSLLVGKGIFEEIQVSFLLVGHTHDDVDASFGRWSMKLRENDYPTIPLLMKSYMDLDEEPFIPALIEEVPDFKSFIDGYISEDDLIGHSKGRQFRFYRDGSGWPLMQYKLRCTDEKWHPSEGIKLWKADDEGKPKLPLGTPRAVLPRSMRGQDDIVRGIKGFIQHWKTVGDADISGEYSRKHAHLLQYWSRVKEALEEPEMEAVDVLCMGFWPRTRQSFDVQTLYNADGELRDEFAEDDHYIGPRSQRPKPSFRVARDCRVGYLLLVRAAIDSDAPIWLAEARSDPILTFGDVNERMIKVQWYKPCARRGKESSPYENWDTSVNFKWEIDATYEEQMTSVISILTAWKAKRAEGATTVTVPKRHVLQALARIAHSIRASPNAPEVASSSDSD